MRPILCTILLLYIFSSCREHYDLPLEPSLSNSLVVEGNILKGDTTQIRLTRVSEVAGNDLRPETGATVAVEGADNTRYQLSESEPGVYRTPPIDLNTSIKYRLKISASGKEYESEWIPVISTSPIDSLFWVRNNGVEILIKSTGGPDDSRYYKWDYEEVWDFYSLNESTIFYNFSPRSSGTLVCDSQEVNGVMVEKCVKMYAELGYPSNDSMYHCWHYNTSTSIHLGASTALSSNIMLSSIRKIEDNGFELTSLYSILVKQTGLSKEGYEFYSILKGNSENMGSIFDAQPSQMKTNINCVTDPTERVIGFVDATTVRTKRLFIDNDEVDGWNYNPFLGCRFTFDTVPFATPHVVDSLIQNDLVPISPLKSPQAPDFMIGDFTIMSKFCMDCRERGVHKKPDFWPY